jgi:predicted glycoside hydrolase/deacetylase ChbG (UPF0249 family)
MTSQPWAGTARASQAAPAVRGRARARGSGPGLPLIVHADDFGETPEITRGICAGIEAGVVTSSSIMVNMPGSEDGLQRAAGLEDRASFGVHLNFCEGRPLTAASSLVDAEGRFHAKRALFARAVTGRLALPELEAEITAQIARVRDAGLRISHVDGHKHLHQLPIVSTAVANVLPRFAIRRVRITRLGTLLRARAPSTWVREILAMKASSKFHSCGLRSPVRIVDLRPFVSDPRVASESCVDPRGPVEMCCHPGTAAADTQKPGSHVRSAELDYLLSPRFRELLNVNGARLVSYWEV